MPSHHHTASLICSSQQNGLQDLPWPYHFFMSPSPATHSTWPFVAPTPPCLPLSLSPVASMLPDFVVPSRRFHFTSSIGSLQKNWHSHFLEPFSLLASGHHFPGFPPFSLVSSVFASSPWSLSGPFCLLSTSFFLRNFIIAIALNTITVFSSDPPLEFQIPISYSI